MNLKLTKILFLHKYTYKRMFLDRQIDPIYFNVLHKNAFSEKYTF